MWLCRYLGLGGRHERTLLLGICASFSAFFSSCLCVLQGGEQVSQYSVMDLYAFACLFARVCLRVCVILFLLVVGVTTHQTIAGSGREARPAPISTALAVCRLFRLCFCFLMLFAARLRRRHLCFSLHILLRRFLLCFCLRAYC